MSAYVEFGWGARPMAEQFPALDPKDAEAFDADSKAIIRLHIRGMITDSQRDAAIRKCTKMVEAALAKLTALESRHGG